MSCTQQTDTQMIFEVYLKICLLCMDRKLLYYKTQIQIRFLEVTQHVLLWQVFNY